MNEAADGRAAERDSAAAAFSAAAPSGSLDLSSCDREPIHIPGSIQPHGFLLALDPRGRVQVASGTAAGFLQLPHSAIFQSTLPTLFGQAQGASLLAALTGEPLTTATRLLPSVALPAAGPGQTSFEAVAYRTSSISEDPGQQPWTVLEFERSFTSDALHTEALNARLYNFVAAIRGMRTTGQVCQAAVEEIAALTGCDRVVLYRFDDQGHGLVLAEQRANQTFASYLGLRFPASDVPAQARRMYLLNRVRIIPNVDYEPSPLLARDGPAPELDLSSSVLRSVSPIHRQYMRNMGTACSMSVSILIEGKLWGLVSCHHHAPRYVPLRLRSACDFTMQIAASQLESQARGRRLERALAARAVQGRLLASMAMQEHYMDGLAHAPESLLELVEADGAAVVSGSSTQLFGAAPTEAEVLPLVEWLRQSGHDELFSSSSLAADYPPAAAFAHHASGVLAISLSRLHNTWVLWFRRELLETVRWAGDPHKPAVPGPVIVSPRHSFDEWAQTVRGCSEPWTAEQLRAAAEFRAAVLEIVLKRAEEIASLALGLQVANQELESFSYSVSHDLRAPFRHISGFAEMLKEEEAGRMSEPGKRYLATILDSAAFAGRLVDSLLDFSRFARSRLTPGPVDMEQLVDSEWQAALADARLPRPIQFSRDPLPRVTGDPELLRQVLRNLFSNAIKYTARQPAPRVRVQVLRQQRELIFSIADNGVGFDQQYAGKLFGVFQRLHRIEDFEGTGIGLANVRRIVGRHGGRTWAEGRVGEGAAFFFSLPLPPERGTP